MLQIIQFGILLVALLHFNFETLFYRTGKLKITVKGKLAKIYLTDAQNKIFATCPVSDESSVERTLDTSGRYFILKIRLILMLYCLNIKMNAKEKKRRLNLVLHPKQFLSNILIRL